MLNKLALPLGLLLMMPLSAVTLDDGCQPPAASEVCDNGIDDDENGFADCDDFACTTDPACEGNLDTCSDGLDNDGDQYTDCEDFDCLQNCTTATLCGAAEATVAACSDGVDNDLDGFTDCDDFDCSRNVCDAVRALCNTAP